MPVPRPKTRDTLASKLKKLMRNANNMTQRELAAASGVSQTQIGNILRGVNSCSVEAAEALAKPFGLSGWQLIAVHIPADYKHPSELEKLISVYTNASEDVRRYIDSIVERERKLGNDGK